MSGMSLPPGFRFHPTDDELVGYYLKKKVDGVKIELEVIPVIDLYKFDPWELPEKSFLPKRDMEWFFFCPRDRKYPNGSRTNRATKAGYWKATGKDKKINCHPSVTGLRKTLVFYLGRAPAGHRTDWVMHEYRLCEELLQGSCSFQGAFSLCRVIKKNEQGNKIGNNQGVFKATVVVSPSSSSSSNEFSSSMFSNNMLRISEENPSPDMNLRNGSNNSTPITSPSEVRKETELEPQSDIDETNFFSPYLHSATSKACMDIGDTASKCLFSNDFTNTLRTWQPCLNSGIPATSSEIIFSQELDQANTLASISPLTPYSRSISCFEMQSEDNAEILGLEQLESYQEFPSTEWSDYPYTNSLTDGSESSHPTLTICRQTSGDGPFGDLSNLWIHDDNLVI